MTNAADHAESSARRHYRNALACGVMPMATGTAIWLLWVRTRWDWLQLAGLLTLIIGLGLFLWGVLHVLVYLNIALRNPLSGRVGVVLEGLTALAVLIANFPVASAILGDVFRFRSPRVSSEWVKARAYEFMRDGPQNVPWPSVGPGRWYFPRERFGIRYCEARPGEGVLLFASDGDGPYAFVLLPDKTLRYSPDDAWSLLLIWSLVLEEGPERFRVEFFEHWGQVDRPRPGQRPLPP
jgi:hypothetical protein